VSRVHVTVLLAGCALLWPVAESWCQNDQPVSVRASAEPTQVKLGEVFTLRLEVVAGAGVNLTLPGADAELKPAEVRSFRTEDQQTDPTASHVSLIYELQLFDLGEHKIQPPGVVYSDSAGKSVEVKPEPVQVSVISALPDDAQDIKGVRGPKPLPLSPWYWVALFAAALLLLALVAAAVRLLLRRSARRAQPAPAPPLSPHAEALAALEELHRRELVARGQHYLYYSELSYIIRRYLERRFRLEALECTTPMLERRLKRSPLVPAAAEGFVEILRRADLVKFAKYQPEDQVAEMDLLAARKLVQLTREMEPEVAAAEAAAE